MTINQKHTLTIKFLLYIGIWLSSAFMFMYAVAKPFLGLYVLVLIPYLIHLVLFYLTFSFTVTEKHIRIERGILFKKIKDIEYTSIQNVEMKAGPLMRIIGIRKFNVWTASQNQLVIRKGNTSNQADGQVVLDKPEAEWLAEYISRMKNISS